MLIVPCYSTNATSGVGNINRLWTVTSQSTGTIGTSVRNLLVMERTYYRYMHLKHGLAGTIPLYVGIIHVLLHRFVCGVGNHKQLSFGAIQWVTDMPTCNASKTCLV